VWDDSTDPLLPPWPVPAFYDRTRKAWMLSRYADVLAAFREARLSPEGGRSEDRPESSDINVPWPARSEILAALSAGILANWQARIEPLAFNLIDRLPEDRPVDIVQEFARPWSLQVAASVTGADPADAKRLEGLAQQVSAATADPSNSALLSDSTAGSRELENYFQNGRIPMSGPAFVALSQTLPCLLANAWLALLRHPAELARLRAEPDLMPRAVEELLRYAGLARTVKRRAMASVDVGRVQIREGERVILMLASANRDPEQFRDPDRLDLTRAAAGQVALGAGPHSCVGASLIRMAAAVATSAFVSRFAAAQSNRPVDWRGGSGFRWAASLYVHLARDSQDR
jgi:cytochrome P450